MWTCSQQLSPLQDPIAGVPTRTATQPLEERVPFHFQEGSWIFFLNSSQALARSSQGKPSLQHTGYGFQNAVARNARSMHFLPQEIWEVPSHGHHAQTVLQGESFNFRQGFQNSKWQPFLIEKSILSQMTRGWWRGMNTFETRGTVPHFSSLCILFSGCHCRMCSSKAG